jgi:Fe-Mn family superoxide dismutase
MYTEKKFNLKEMNGISERTMTEHLKLYSGYVKNANLINEKITELKNDYEKNSYILSELIRRFSFEFNGIRNHEVFFSLLEGGHTPPEPSSDLYKAIVSQYGDFDLWQESFKKIALTRGIGWAMLYFDSNAGNLVHGWIDEQHIGQLNACNMIIAIDMWEHAFIIDYSPSDKKKYIDAFFQNINWKQVEQNYKNSLK